MRWWFLGAGCWLSALAGCSRAATPEAGTHPAPVAASSPAPAAAAPDTQPARPPQRRNRVAPPQIALQLDLMGHSSTGMSGFRLAHPRFDGRGVLIAVMDGGVDPGISGLRFTSTGERKILDVRDFSGEGRIVLRPAPTGRPDTFTGEFHEILLGDMPQADVNGDGDNRDTFRVEVTRDSLGWKARVDTDGDNSLDDESWVRDYLLAGETFTFSSRFAPRGRGPITAAVNLSDENGSPSLTLVLDTSGHGSHVAGIAAGNDIYDVAGFDGVAPGAQLLALKFADNLRGSVTTNTSVMRAMRYAARFAAERRMPLVINMSFGVGNANMGRAAMDSIVDAFLVEHPDVVFVIAAGNEGPGTSTMGLPGSSELALTVGAVYPRSLAILEYNNPNDVLGWWGSRGGALAKPDVVAPGVQYSTVPGWKTGDEISGGTSMAAPYVSGVAAVLLSAAAQEHLEVTGIQVIHAIRATARPLPGVAFIDQGHGIPRVGAAWEWLRSGHQALRWRVEAIPPGARGTHPGVSRGVSPAARERLTTAAYRRGTLSAGDTVQRFRVSAWPVPSGGAGTSLTYRLTSDASWLRPASDVVTVDPRTGSAVVEVRYEASLLAAPGRHTGAVRGTNAADTLAGAAFVLVNTVLVPDTLGTRGIRVEGKRLAAGGAARWYVSVPEGAAGLSVSVTVRDTSMRGTLELYEPTDRPSRGAKAAEVGGPAGRTAALSVPSQYLPPGVWEVVLQALPGADLHYDLSARLPPLSIVSIDSSPAPRVVISSRAGGDPAVEARLELVGVARDFAPLVRHGMPTRVSFPVPAWATRVRVESEVAPELWDRVTDYALTLFDSSGARLGVEAMSYPYDRLEADLPQRSAGTFEATLELFPGFAAEPPDTHTVRLRVRFEGDSLPLVPPRLVGAADSTTLWSEPVGGLEVPEGWRYLLRFAAGDGRGAALTTRLFTVPSSSPR